MVTESHIDINDLYMQIYTGKQASSRRTVSVFLVTALLKSGGFSPSNERQEMIQQRRKWLRGEHMRLNTVT